MQEVICITGGNRLSGAVRVAGAKNAALPLLAATALTSEECKLTNVPDLEDIAVTLRLLRSLGADTAFEGSTASIRLRRIKATETPYSLVKALRASFWLLGPLLARCGEARIPLPGGDAIGTRPVDLHLKGLAQFGAQFRMKHGVVIAEAPGRLHPAHITLEYPSVGATHQLLMTAALIPGETVIDGAAREPEVLELALMLTEMGASIDGAGTSRLRIKGRRELGGCAHAIIGDRIEAATYLLCAAVTQGRVTVEGLSPSAISSTLDLLEQAGCTILRGDETITASANTGIRAVSFDTAPYPGVATDVQPLLMAGLTKAEGQSVIRETVFENRFGHAAEYRRFGADIVIDGQTAVVTGVRALSAAPVEARDIRAAAGEVLMGLMAEGVTQISDIYHLDRGYDGLVLKLRSLGADISRIPAFDEKEVVFGC